MNTPRGIRNNNPGNIRHSKADWLGATEYQKDESFVQFKEPVWGLRALMRTLVTYFRTHELRTIEKIINRWAPPEENLTASYVWGVARDMNVPHRKELELDRATLILLAQAITKHENGAPPPDNPEAYWYPYHLYNEASKMALPDPTA